MERIDTSYGLQKQKKVADGQIPVFVRTCDFQPGGIVAFYHGYKRLNSRLTSVSWDWFGIGKNGNVSINGNESNERRKRSAAWQPNGLPEGHFTLL